jgi:HAD-superfamily hydrolase, subfamily IIB
MYKLIACDLDETLLDDHHQICIKNKEMIKKATELGVKFVPATGRGFMAVQNILKDLDLYQKENEYTLAFNGAALVENKNNKMILFEGLTFAKAKELFEFGLDKDVCIQVYTDTVVYMYNLNNDERQRYHKAKTEYVELIEPTIDFLKDQLIAKVIYQNTDIPYLNNIQEEMKSLTDGEISISYSSNRYMELNRLGVDKGNTMLKLAEILGIKPEETIAVGDNYNDMPMLLVAGLSVAANNAVDGVKEVCDYVCENDNNQGVVAELIEKFILNV